MNVIGSWSISNGVSMNLYEILYGLNDQALVGLGSHTPRRYTINSDRSGRQYVTVGNIKYYMDECMRAN